MKNIDLTKEVALRKHLKSISNQNHIKVYMVGSQLNNNVESTDLNLIGVMENKKFHNTFNLSFDEVKMHLDSFDYSDIGLIKYLMVVNKIEVEIKFKTQMKLTFKLVDESNFDYNLPYVLIEYDK